MASLSRAIKLAPLSRVRIYNSTRALPNSYSTKFATQTERYISKPRHFHTTSANMTADSFLTAIKARRTYYQLEASSTISDERIQEIVNQVVLHTPSSFNSQSTRALVLIGDEHKKLWATIVKPAVKAVAPAESWPGSEKRLSGFENAYGTVLFFEDTKVVEGLQQKMPIYADKFPQWSEHTNGMHALNLWTALELEGLGANLQHYNPLITDGVSKTWEIPSHWDLKAQLVFGKPTGQPGEKAFNPLEERVKYFGGKL